MNKILITIVGLLVVIAALAFYFLNGGAKDDYQVDVDTVDVSEDMDSEAESSAEIEDGSDEMDSDPDPEQDTNGVLGTSVDNRPIEYYSFGDGDKEVVFVGGIHGGYSWNTALVAYELIDYLEDAPEMVPEGVKVTVIPAVNPDGLSKVTGKDGRFVASDVEASDSQRVLARFNENEVDLNRNFDCQWESQGTWQSRAVSGGTSAFSEPESDAVRRFLENADPEAVVVWYSAAGGVYSSSCNNGILPETATLTQVYAGASGYDAFDEFDSYEITGDMVNWLASERIPAISVLLSDHQSTEWTKNKAGIEAVLNHIAG